MSEQAISTSPDRQGAPEAEYGASYYSNYWGGGGPYERNERWLKFFGEVADGIIRDFHPTSVLDAGCAMGFLVEELRKRGVDAAGIDVSDYAISQVHESAAPHCSVASLTEPLAARYDLITCIEVLEHLPPAETDLAIANLCAATDRLLISSTPGDYGEPTHLNVLPPEAWSAKFAQQGFMRDLERDLSYLSPWAALYVRQDEPRAETVRRYDRAWSRLRREVSEVRSSLLQSQDQLAELEAGGGVDNQPELAKELDRQNEEILRLRDLLIGKDAELGTAKGRVAEMEDRMKRLDAAKLRIESGIPLGKLPGKLLRLFRSLRA
jgi:SAM-dependent methyltransferase